MDIDYITEIDTFTNGYASNARKLAYSKDDFKIELTSLENSSYIKNIKKASKDDSKFIFEINRSKKISCGIKNKILSDLKKANPSIDICLDDALLNMEEDEDLVFKSKNPLWCLKELGNILVLRRVF